MTRARRAPMDRRSQGPTDRVETGILQSKDRNAAHEAATAAQLARVALIVSAMAFALALLGLFLPIH